MGFGSWCLIESDPGVFFGLFEALGGKGLTFQEVYGLDAATFEAQLSQPPRRQVFGFIFLFNFDKDRGARSADEAAQQLDLVDPLSPEAPFFARQTVQNACASQALLSVLMNLPSGSFETTKELAEIMGFFREIQEPTLRGESIGNCDAVREAHNSFGRNRESFIETPDEPKADPEDAFHYVAYVPLGKKVYELDGLREAPVCVGSFTEESSWVEVVRLELQRRVNQLKGELRFNLIAVTSDPLPSLATQVAQAKALAEDASQTAEVRVEAEAKLKELTEQQTAEEEVRKRWTKENERRRHNWMPFVIHALKHLARQGKLVESVKAARQAVSRS